MSNQMTIYDISKKAGVSIATVSRVLNGSTNVKPRTKKKVMDIIEQYGYKPNAFARGLGLNSMKTIGILCADASDLYLAKAIYYIEQNLRENGYHSVLCCTGYEMASRKDSLNLLLSQHVDSVVMVGSNFIMNNAEDNQYVKDAAATVPIMLLNADFDCSNVYCTLCDDYKATQDATEKMLDAGMQNILYLYNSNSYSGLKKLAGYQNALLTHDIPLKKELQQCFKGSHEDIDGVKNFVDHIYKKGIRFDGIVTSDDFLAVGAMNFARANNINVPGDLQIIGYNNSILTLCSEPDISSVDNRLEDMCIQLVKTLIGTLSQNEMPQKTIFSGELIKRGSTSF
ncbi:transcriptional regulator LacI family [Butyrivibrio proteoclasticus B316]|uniref:Transcriptional regulator LacI family n=1 Tax=Butyrivibrio proteoclasticus (strain ATCC 51982 / DSM 14932 / B316) TaxID=515622 RepID=E0RV59_BUTPB|nr:LacI family DNA-binding transcriptional regulator [Butyrivibrio proteoclasticus]ADL34329.1 transcriptional regulator LacI family [Butyrivibrio proteoclasticus B316]